MWEKQEPPLNRGYTSTYTTFKKEQTIKDYIATSSPITLLTFYCQVLRPTPVGPWARGELQREGGFIGCPPQPLMASMTTHLATPFVPVLTITSPTSFLTFLFPYHNLFPPPLLTLTTLPYFIPFIYFIPFMYFISLILW